MEYELTHWGVKGMKWGVRRYQNKDGSLTPAGKKRRAKLEGELEKLGGSKKTEGGSSSGSASRPKSISEMSNKELQEQTTRMMLEKNYYDAKRQLATSNPKQVSAGEKFAKEMIDEAIIPAVSNAGKSYLNKIMNQAMGIDNKDTVAELKKTFDTLDYKQKIDKIQNPDKYLNYEERTKKYNLEKQMKKDADEAAKAAKEKADADAKAKAKYDDEMNKYREYNKQWADPQSSSNASGSYRKSGGERGYVNPNESRGLAVYGNSPVTSLANSTVSKGKNHAENHYDYQLTDKNGNSLRAYNSDDDVYFRR